MIDLMLEITRYPRENRHGKGLFLSYPRQRAHRDNQSAKIESATLESHGCNTIALQVLVMMLRNEGFLSPFCLHHSSIQSSGQWCAAQSHIVYFPQRNHFHLETDVVF